MEVSVPVDLVPLVASLPDQAPEAVHEVALVEDQLKVEPLPLVTLVGLALSDTVGLLVAPLPWIVMMADFVEPRDAPWLTQGRSPRSCRR